MRRLHLHQRVYSVRREAHPVGEIPEGGRSHNMSTADTDVVIVGGGIVGLATALAITEAQPGRTVTVPEKEPEVATHQTGRNSGVIHSGIYYRPGTLRAHLCLEGVRLLTDFCDAHGVPYDMCGKLIVATDDSELPALHALMERGVANGVPGLELVDPERMKQIEPHVRGVGAIHSPATGIVDYAQVSRTIRDLLRERGVTVRTGAHVTGIAANDGSVTVTGPGFELKAGQLVNCAGLHSDAVACASGLEPSVRIVPFRGEYYLLRKSAEELVRGLIYPVPDARLPFLGVHFTRMMRGGVEAGPNAVFAFAREGYTPFRVNPWDLSGTFAYPGFWKLAARFWRTGAYEYWRSFSKNAFTQSLQKMIPEITSAD